MDKLDLLGIRGDYEMELQAKYELAKRIAEYWKVNCTDDEFYKNCLHNIREELGETNIGVISDEVYEIWDIIEENYL